MLRKNNWSYGVIKDDKPKLQPLLDTLRRLYLRGLTAGMVAVVFHYRRVLPLMQRRLRLDEMTSGIPLEGSQMSHETLPLDEVARRARWMVGSFRQEDIDRVLMRPNQGFEPLVSIVLLVLRSPSSLGLVDLKLIEFIMQDLTVLKDSLPPAPKDRVAREVRRLSTTREKEEKDATKSRRNLKAHEREALLRHRCNRTAQLYEIK
jgi:hypothetical protein